MKRKNWIWCLGIMVIFISCEKEYSEENGGTPSELIVGLDCRISKITYRDTSGMATGGTGTPLGFIEAQINSLDIVTKITRFDSVSNTIEFISTPVYSNDTVFINPDEYFLVDINKRITQLHALLDPTDPFSLQYDIFYLYNTAGYLVTKSHFLTISPGTMFFQANYTYLGGNLTHMTGVDQFSGDTIINADMHYYSNLVPQRYLYFFPDEKSYSYFNQFFNFGLKNYNAIKDITVRNYDPGYVLRDSSVSTFSNYVLSRDNYVLSVQMGKDDQQSIPASAGKLSFSYHCK